MSTLESSDNGSAAGCKFCTGARLRRSRLRVADFPRLLLLRWPVRCLACGKRQHALITVAMRAISSRAPHAPELRERESWQKFTGKPAVHLSGPEEGDR